MDAFSEAKTAGQLMLQRISQDGDTQDDYPTQTDSTLGQTTGEEDGHFYYAMNAKDGIIISIDSKSPNFTKQSKAIATGEPVDNVSATTLQTWSDITYLSWHEECTKTSTPLKNLKHIIRSHITNSETLSVITEILEEEKIIFPTNGLSVEIDDSKGYGAALLGTPNGKVLDGYLHSTRISLGMRRS
ncbi:uncharacterized protein EAF02_009954 [Botrytis sinoallii]|uniref:uncharacterized protein n=1 Tax=Botrytis sinoallii TaxID=1463999 RepID=UPI001901FCBC|nr:uncharacterized protein EAF02_009954 [Botrytis sinoallii]KAF7865531.1 hypothetical protein EAF02_009954 [Botrytis sinoallii]